ncbi:ABC transporter permease [Ruania alba]|uniref:Peptide/nickel transport system permease protein n=1 Tax=Ruania alba TaxID=648782 RepID=A0A1H5N6P1_9MICO|nr:ABC transporter permease [Ruania alba]SEE97206.1 peptide/nickel transport system permease protein [Ruania alba]
MLTFIVRRTLIGLGILLVSSLIMYVLVDFTIDPLMDLRTSTAPDRDIQIQQRIDLLRLDDPVLQRYLSWIGAFVTGDLGTAWTTGRDVADILAGAIVSTIQLVTASTLLAIFLGIAVGIVSALRQYTSFDYLITFFSFLLYSLPSFWVAVLLKQWGAIGYNDFLRDPVIAIPVILAIVVVTGFLWSLAFGGNLRRRLTVAGTAAGVTLAVLLYMQLTDWWSRPNIGPVLLTITAVAIALAVTTLSTGLKNRRALYTALTVAVLGIALYFPMQWGFYYLTVYGWMSWGTALLLGAVAAVVGGVIGALYRGPDWRQSVRTGALTAVPIAALLFVDRVMQVWPDYADALGGRPIATVGDRTPNLGGDFWVVTLDQYTHLLLPTISLMLISFAGYTRYARGSMLEVMNQDYIRTARAKGLTERTVVMRHGFRNSLIPMATIVPIDVITLIGGAIITENIFGRPGMGQMFLRHLGENDIEPVMAYLLIVAALSIVANIVADLIYAVLDPRIRVNA